MEYRGRVRNGRIVLEPGVNLPDGTLVEVRVRESETLESAEQIPTLYDRLRPFIGQASDLPPDMSVNHDHYLYGTPNRS